MRRSEKEIASKTELEDVIRAGTICRLAIAADPVPYIVPLNYGYRSGVLYFHSAPKGRKIDLLKLNPRASFEISLDLGLVEGEKACDWSARFRSVIGFGQIVFLQAPEEKRRALDVIMAHYAQGPFSYADDMLARTTIFSLVIEKMTGKQSGL